jgi:hypothetical protein
MQEHKKHKVSQYNSACRAHEKLGFFFKIVPPEGKEGKNDLEYWIGNS